MDQEQLYSTIGPLRASQMSESHRQSISGLMLTIGVANRYKSGELSESQAREQIQAVIDTGRVPDAKALKSLTDALSGDQVSLEKARLNNLLDHVTQAGNTIADPFVSSPAGAITLGLGTQFTPMLLKYLVEPDNILTGQFIPPRPDPILTTGAASFTQIGRILDQHQELEGIYKAVFPELSGELGIGMPDSLKALVDGLQGNIGNAARNLVDCVKSGVGIPEALSSLEETLTQRLDESDVAVKELVTMQRDERREKHDFEKKQAESRHIQAEINGGIQLFDMVLSYALGPGVARKATGCLNAALSIQRLLASNPGPLALVGGVASLIAGALGLFDDGPDPMLERLNQIDRRLEHLESLLREGLERLDKKLDALHTLSASTLREVLESRRLTTVRLAELSSKIDVLTTFSASYARDNTAQDLYLAIEEFRHLTSDNLPLNDFVNGKLPVLGVHVSRYARSSHMNGRVDQWGLSAFRTVFDGCGDTRRALGNLANAASYVSPRLRLPLENVPDVSYWTVAVQLMLEMLIHAPDVTGPSTMKRLEEVWNDGHRTRESILEATSPAILLSTLDRVEQTFLRQRSGGHVRETLDEIIAESLLAPFAAVQQNLGELLADRIAGISERVMPLLDDALVFNFLMSTMLWRLSSSGDAMSVDPENVCGPPWSVRRLAEELTIAVPHRELMRQDGPDMYFLDDVHAEILKAWRASLANRFDHLRRSIRTSASSLAVRDLDNSLQGIFVVAQSRGKDLTQPVMPRFRLPPARNPATVWEVDLALQGSELLELCAKADQSFVGYAGDIADPMSGLRHMTNSPLALPGLVMPADAPGNSGHMTFATVFLPPPSTWQRLEEEFDVYATFLRGLVAGTRQYPDRIVPRHVAHGNRDMPDSLRMAYFTRAPRAGEFPFEVALVGRHLPGNGDRFGPGFTLCKMELWVFNRKSGGVRRA